MSNESAFPELTDELIEHIVDMEYVTQSDSSWKEAPATAVLLAVQVLKTFFSREHETDPVVLMAKETIFRYGDWSSKHLDISRTVRQEMYQRNYDEGEPWEEWYRQDGFSR